ncbi:unnamed protein product, partial [Ectocarpus sp. 12 AP-2014]
IDPRRNGAHRRGRRFLRIIEWPILPTADPKHDQCDDLCANRSLAASFRIQLGASSKFSLLENRQDRVPEPGWHIYRVHVQESSTSTTSASTIFPLASRPQDHTKPLLPASTTCAIPASASSDSLTCRGPPRLASRDMQAIFFVISPLPCITESTPHRVSSVGESRTSASNVRRPVSLCHRDSCR